MKDKLRAWLSDDLSGMEQFLDTSDRPDARREDIEREDRRWREDVLSDPATREAIRRGRERARGLYRVVAVAGCIVFILAILFVIAHLPRFGEYAPQMAEVADRYIGSGLEETGATNIVAGMILDYRAFDTLGESFVLFTALICSTVLLRLDAKNQRSGPDSYGSIRSQAYFDTSSDRILRLVGTAAVPVILVFGIYILLNGHLSPGGGFSGGAILGAGLIILSSSLGLPVADSIFTAKRLNLLSFAALAFYSLSKCYVFFVGANHLHAQIPKGIPGAILSGGLILPLNIAVGLVVACTMYGFYTLFQRGTVGGA